ncbi:hypothetical protein BT96DRAFT_697788 [Gymnopus androsaceus JB14]|uniref:Uncharacterized protein n=1 Tax=Gymnopus androsaceus JB14 TaxID=1447944 RepID=A0A6A4IGJ2_9AGAR|nr:hypothetical protein BT96DRAFT_697788 [Gymnopus androsaceus JB14]
MTPTQKHIFWGELPKPPGMKGGSRPGSRQGRIRNLVRVPHTFNHYEAQVQQVNFFILPFAHDAFQFIYIVRFVTRIIILKPFFSVALAFMQLTTYFFSASWDWLYSPSLDIWNTQYIISYSISSNLIYLYSILRMMQP